MSKAEFYKPEPVKPEDSKIAKALKWSLRISVAGWAIYGPFAFAFADLGIVPTGIQSALVLLGSALIVIGSETNTIPTLVAALSKVGTKRFSVWDGAAVLASLVGSLCNVLITFSGRQVKLSGTPWREFAIIKGPLFLGIASTLDLYGAAMEKAFLKRDYERDMEQWLEERRLWLEAQHEVEQQDPANWRKAEIEDWRRISAGMNGDRPTTPKGLEEVLAKERLLMPQSKNTVYRWLRMGREGR